MRTSRSPNSQGPKHPNTAQLRHRMMSEKAEFSLRAQKRMSRILQHLEWSCRFLESLDAPKNRPSGLCHDGWQRQTAWRGPDCWSVCAFFRGGCLLAKGRAGPSFASMTRTFSFRCRCCPVRVRVWRTSSANWITQSRLSLPTTRNGAVLCCDADDDGG